jgi:hypothetical protein
MPDSLESRFCRHLRSKHYFFLSTVPTTAEELADASNFYWCSTTMQCLGPDGERVCPSGCGSDRACYRNSFEQAG